MHEAVVARAEDAERKDKETLWRKVVKQDQSADFEFHESLVS